MTKSGVVWKHSSSSCFALLCTFVAPKDRKKWFLKAREKKTLKQISAWEICSALDSIGTRSLEVFPSELGTRTRSLRKWTCTVLVFRVRMVQLKGPQPVLHQAHVFGSVREPMISGRVGNRAQKPQRESNGPARGWTGALDFISADPPEIDRFGFK